MIDIEKLAYRSLTPSRFGGFTSDLLTSLCGKSLSARRSALFAAHASESDGSGVFPLRFCDGFIIRSGVNDRRCELV